LIKITFTNISFNDRIKFFKEANEISIVVEGHAGAGTKGNDIICSAVSALSQTMVISITKIAGIPQKVTQEEGYLRSEIEINSIPDISKNVLRNILDFFTIGIFEIIKNYPERIKVVFNTLDKNDD